MRARPLVWYMTQAYRIRGGHEAHLLHFATEMRTQGFDTCIVVLDELPRQEHRFMQQLRARGISLSALRRRDGLGVRALFLLLLAPWALVMVLRGRRAHGAALLDYVANRLAARTLRIRLQREQPDLIHILGRLAAYAWPVLPAARCLLHHGTEGRRDESWDEVEFEAFRQFAQRAARNFAPGSGVAENLAREFHITQPIETLYTICPDEKPAGWQPPEPPSAAGAVAPPHFGLLARMTPEKGIHDLLEALLRYTARHGTVRFTFAGTGVLEGEVRAFIARHGLDEVRVQTEFTSPAEVLAAWDVFVHPSRSDAMPMAIAEALMNGLPCVVTRAGGIPDLVRDGEEGILIDAGQPDQIVNAMERFAAMTPTQRWQFRRRARARYEQKCRPEQVGMQLAAHYRTLLGRLNEGNAQHG